MFSANVEHVDDTKIFARGAGTRQFLVYQMAYQADVELSMILPIPTPPGSDEDAVTFIDLSAYPEFFDDLGDMFPAIGERDHIKCFSIASEQPTLAVHRVGSFEASFVPGVRDFARLDERFRLPDDIWHRLPIYADYGFVVFRLQAGAYRVHPMAFSFPRRDANVLFFPSVHVHHGDIEQAAEFRHTLYCQAPGAPTDQSGVATRWTKAENPLVEDVLWYGEESDLDVEERHLHTPIGIVDVERSQHIVHAEEATYASVLRGTLPNRDVMVTF